MHNARLPLAGNGWRRLAATTFALAVALVGAATAASPAQAVDDIDAVSQGSAENSASVKSILVNCPTGTKVYGTGASIQVASATWSSTTSRRWRTSAGCS